MREEDLEDLERPLVRLHRSKLGTYHLPEDLKPGDEQWTVHDSKGCLDHGPWCDDCGACDCRKVGNDCLKEHAEVRDGESCVGLDFAYCDLDSGDVLCPTCMMRNYNLQISDCPREKTWSNGNDL
jgi:hypothetical protein